MVPLPFPVVGGMAGSWSILELVTLSAILSGPTCMLLDCRARSSSFTSSVFLHLTRSLPETSSEPALCSMAHSPASRSSVGVRSPPTNWQVRPISDIIE